MNIASISNNNVSALQSTNFKSAQIIGFDKKDSFERSEKICDADISYPQVVVYNSIKKKNGTLNSQAKDYELSTKKKLTEQKSIQAEFVDLYAKTSETLLEIISLSNKIQKLKKLISDENNEAVANHYKGICRRNAEKIKELISQYEELQAQLEEFYASNEADFADISNGTLDLYADNIEYYKNLADSI